MLLAVAECAAVGNDTDAQQIVTAGNLEAELYGCRLSGIYREFTALGGDDFLRSRLEEGEHGCAFDCLICKVGDACGYLCPVSYPHEARHIRGEHEFFGGNGGGVELACHHVFGMGVAAEIPTCQALRHSEREGYFSLLIGA